jgi:hypothetical protein
MHLQYVGDDGEWTGSGAGGLTSRSGEHLVARSVLMRRNAAPGLFGGTSTEYTPTGETEGYVCTECGYLEEYVKSTREIAWDSIEGATWHSPPAGGGPFR